MGSRQTKDFKIDPKTMEFVKLTEEMKKFCVEREIELGYTDTYYGHLALLIQDKIAKALAAERSKLVEEARKILTVDVTKMDWVEGYSGWPEGIEPCMECENGSKISKFLAVLTKLREGEDK